MICSGPRPAPGCAGRGIHRETAMAAAPSRGSNPPPTQAFDGPPDQAGRSPSLLARLLGRSGPPTGRTHWDPVSQLRRFLRNIHAMKEYAAGQAKEIKPELAAK